MFEALSCGSNVKRMKETLQKNPNFTKLDLESAKAISGILGVKIDLNKIKEEDKENKPEPVENPIYDKAVLPDFT